MGDDSSDSEVTQAAIEALLVHLIRIGKIEPSEVAAAADTEQSGGTDFDVAVAHRLRAMILNASAPTIGDWLAQQRRSQMRVVGDVE